MSDFTLFICGVVVTLIVSMGVTTSQVLMGYTKFMKDSTPKNNPIMEVEQ